MDGPTFMVERFVWGAPDRLEVAGTFSGLAAETLGGAVLTVVGEDGARRLPAIGNGDAAPPADGAPWAAEFAWLEAPVAFDRARLELGAGLAVELPAPGTATNGDPLVVEVLEEAVETEPTATEAPPAPPVAAEAADATGRLRLEAQLLDQAEQLGEARTAAQRAEAALLRAETDLAAEREGRAADAERFHDGLAQLRSSAEEAIAELEPASAERDAARIELAEARMELEAVRGELEVVRAEVEDARGEVEDARGALDAARADAQALVDRLSGRR